MILSAVIGVLFVAPVIVSSATIYSSGTLLQPGDVNSSHILNGTILNIDVNGSAAIDASKIAGGGAGGLVMLSNGTRLATSTSFKYSTSTGDLYILAGRIHATSTNFNSVNYSWPSADGSANNLLTTDGAGNLSWSPPPSKFGGSGADGALAISSGTTTIDLAGARYYEKNYTTISITSTGALAFINPASGGTFISLKATGNVTLTCGGWCISVKSLGASGGVNGSCGAGVAPSAANSFYTFYATLSGGGGGAVAGTAGGGGIVSSLSNLMTMATPTLQKYGAGFWVGGGGGEGQCNQTGGGSPVGGPGGRGGGSLLMEVGSAINMTASNAIVADGESPAAGVNANGGNCEAGGGGGAGGMVVIYANTLTSVAGSISTAGGTGANTGAVCNANAAGGGGGGTPFLAGSAGAVSASTGVKTGGDGAVGTSTVLKNTNF